MISLNVFILFISRFSYIIVNTFFEQEGNFFGFGWLSTFVWSLGIEMFTISVGFLILYGSYFMPNRIGFLYRIVSYITITTGIFFMNWIFLDGVVANKTLEIIFSIAVGVPLAVASIQLYKAVLAYMKGMKFAYYETLMMIFNRIPDKYLQENMLAAYDKEVVDPTLRQVNQEYVE